MYNQTNAGGKEYDILHAELSETQTMSDQLILLDGGSKDRLKVSTMFLILAMGLNGHLTYC